MHQAANSLRYFSVDDLETLTEARLHMLVLPYRYGEENPDRICQHKID
jgi:hypothetical protein